MYYDDLTIILTGLPAMNETGWLEKRVNNYSQYGKVIVQKYDSVNDSMYACENTNFTLLNLPDSPPPLYGALVPKYNYQVYSIHSTLTHVNTKYTLKTRADEYYHNLEPLINYFLNNDNKFISSLAMWSEQWPHYLGDHIFIAKTELLQDIYNDLFGLLITQTSTPGMESPEYLLYIALVKCIKDKYAPNAKYLSEIMDVFDETLFENVIVKTHVSDIEQVYGIDGAINQWALRKSQDLEGIHIPVL